MVEIKTKVHDIDERLTFTKYKGGTLYTALLNEPDYIVALHDAMILRVNDSLIKLAKEFVRGRMKEEMYVDTLYQLNKYWDEDKRY